MSQTDTEIDPTDPSVYPHWAEDVLRYRDTDRQGHVNNAVFSTFFETGRVMLFYALADGPLATDGQAFVIARLTLDYRAEIRWPGTVRCGTGVLRVGKSSMTLQQGLFVGESCAATAESVIVLTDEATRRSTPIPDAVRARLEALRVG